MFLRGKYLNDFHVNTSMSKRGGVLLLIVVLACSILNATVLLADENIYSYETLELKQTISNDIKIVPLRSNYDVSYLEMELFLVPEKSYRQRTISQNLQPSPLLETDEKIVFRWTNPTATTLSSQTEFIVQTRSTPVQISSKVNFPVTNIPLAIQEYIAFTAYIDTNDAIKETALRLASGVDDLFELQFVFAEWVNKEITYNLTSITSEANKPSSWVYENKYGVCDEITNLFISLNRAVGVPARFVSGIAYSDMVDTKWGNHGWAEVYFPEFGWVPFDVTYGQYGFVDASHISFSKQSDGAQPSVRYATRGNGFDFEPNPLIFTTTIRQKGELLGENTIIHLAVEEKEIGFSSFNLLKATVKNNNPFYVVEELSLVDTEGLIAHHEKKQKLWLSPFEEKEVFWLLEVKDGLESNYIYTFPLTVLQSKRTKTDTYFKVSPTGEFFSKLYMQQFINNQPNKELTITCQTRETMFINETVLATCSFIKDEFPVLLCNGDDCQRLVSTKDQATFELATDQVGTHTVAISSADNVHQTFITYKVSDIALVAIQNSSIPPSVRFGEEIVLETALHKKSLTPPQNVTFSVTSGFITESWTFEELTTSKEFKVVIDSASLVSGKNTFLISATYTDNLGKEHTIREELETVMIATSMQEKARSALNRFSIWVNSAGSNISKSLVGENNEEFERFLVLFITFLCLTAVIATVKISWSAVRKLQVKNKK